MTSGPATDRVRPATRLEWIGLAIATAALMAVSLPGMVRNALWLDEAYTVAAVEHLGVSLSETRGTMPLYYGAMWLWGQVSVAPWWMRLPSLGASVAVLVGTQAIARRFLRPVAAALVPVVLVAVPMFSAKAIDARPYALWTLLVVLSWWSVLRLGELRTGEPGRRAHLVGVTAIAILGPLVHGLFVFQVFALVAFVVVARRPGITPRMLVPAIGGCGLVTQGLLVYAGERISGASAAGSVTEALAASYLGVSTPWRAAVGIGAFVGLIALIGRIRSGTRLAWVPVVWLGVPLAMLLWVNRGWGLFFPRYVAPSAPAVALAVGAGVGGLTWLARRAVPKAHSGLACRVVVAGIVVLGMATVLQGPQLPEGEVIEDWDEVATYVATHARPGDGIAFGYWEAESTIYKMQFRVPFEVAWAALHDPPALEAISPARRLGAARRIDDLAPDAAVVARAADVERLWIVTYRGSWAEGLVKSPEFRAAFVAVAEQRFPERIRVTLYERHTG